MPGIARVYAETKPDVIGLQEASHTMVDLLAHELQKLGLRYTVLWARFTSILYRSELFEVADAEYLCYPEHFEGYEGCFNNAKTKGYNIAYFRHKESGRCFVFATTHLWWKHEGSKESWQQPGSDEARRQQIAMVMAHVEEFCSKYGACPAIVVGDLNCQIGSPALNYALGEAGYTHAHDLAEEYVCEGAGYCRCGERPADHWEPLNWANALDHVLIKDAPEGWVRRLDRHTPDYYLHLSDHAPVYIDVAL